MASVVDGQRCVLIKIIIFIRLLCFPQCGVRFSLYVVAPSQSFGAFLVLVSDPLVQRHKQEIRRRLKYGMMPGSIMRRRRRPCINPYTFLWPILLLLQQRALP